MKTKLTLTIDGRDLQNLLACLDDAEQNGVEGAIEYRVEEESGVWGGLMVPLWNERHFAAPATD